MPRKSPLPGFAAETDVPVDRSKAQLEALLMRAGADGYHTGWSAPSGDDPGWDAIEFLWRGKQIRFRLPRPRRDDKRLTHNAGGHPRTPAQLTAVVEQVNRQRWRALTLVVKAKLEAVQSGVSIFEEEFMAFIVMGNGKTIGEVLVPRIQAAGESGRLGIPEMTTR